MGHKRAELAAWVEASSTFWAFFAAIVAVGFASGAYLLEHRREQRWLESRQSEQASVVAAWPAQDVREVKVLGGSAYGTAWGTRTVTGVRIRNASQVPVTAVCAVARGADSVVIGRIMVKTVPPDDEAQFHQWDDSALEQIEKARLEVNGDEDWMPDVDLYFTDAAGLRWYRSAAGSLRVRFPGEEAPPLGESTSVC